MILETDKLQSIRHRLAMVLRIGFSLLVVVLVIQYARKQSWRQVLETMHHANWPLLIGSTLLAAPLVWCKARRLHLLLAPSAHLSTIRLMRVFCASYAADNLIMGQAGLGVRVALLRRAGTTWTTAVSLEILEKALEGMGLALVAIMVMHNHSLPSWVATTMRGCFIVALVAGVITLALILAGHLRNRWTLMIGDAARALKHPRTLVEILFLTIISWGLELTIVTGTLHSLGLPAQLSTAALVLIAVNLAALIPGLPANIGPFEASAVFALRTVGIAAPQALGFALLYHLLHTVPFTLIGLNDLRSSWRYTSPTTPPTS